MDIKLRWSIRVLAVLAAGLLVQILLARSIALLGANKAAQSWLQGSLGRSVTAIHREKARDLRSATELLTATRGFQHALAREDPVALDVAVATYLHRADLSWTAWSSANGGSLTGDSAERCLPGPLAMLEDGMGVLQCGGRARLAVTVPLDLGSWADSFSVAIPLDGSHARLLSDVTGAEVLLLDGPIVVTTLRDADGAVIAPGLPRDMVDAVTDGRTHFGTYRLTMPDYGGLTDKGSPGPSARWAVASRRLSDVDPVVLVLLAPASRFTLGVHAATLILLLGSLVLLVVFGGLLDRALARFIHPVASLVRSARDVGNGDLRTRVPVPADGEMRELCLTYNDMVSRLRDQMSMERTLSREAGRAEVATDVLHNVGNVLTSVVVSANQAMEHFERESPHRLDRLAALFRDDPELSEALERTERGRTAMAYLEAIARRASDERETISTGLQTLLDHVDHLKVVVGAHHTFAGAGGLVERCDLSHLLDDALLIAGVHWSHHGIEVDVDRAGDGTVHVDRHRVLQVLINLLRNARDAVIEQAPRTPSIRVRADASIPGRLRITVFDNGVGVEPDDLDRVFVHGFTTKPSGNGFGLHASALAARDMGGELTCHSDGRGRGAVFTLDIPSQRPGTATGAPPRVRRSPR